MYEYNVNMFHCQIKDDQEMFCGIVRRRHLIDYGLIMYNVHLVNIFNSYFMQNFSPKHIKPIKNAFNISINDTGLLMGRTTKS